MPKQPQPRLRGQAPLAVPASASTMYARNFRPPALDDALVQLISRVFGDLKRRWQHDPAPDRLWDTPAAIAPGGRPALKGNCNDFAPELKRRLAAAAGRERLPEEALRLVLCTYDGAGHMVLAIETAAGTLICCNVVGCRPLGHGDLRLHDYLAWEAPGRPWESLVPLGLEEVLRRHRQA